MTLSHILNRHRGALLALTTAFLFTGSTAAEASWINAMGQVNTTGIIDNLIQTESNGTLSATVATAQFNDGQKGFYAQGDLAAGTLKARAFINGGNGGAGATPVIGETVTFNNTTGSLSSWDFKFGVDGFTDTGANPFSVTEDFGGTIGVRRTTFIQLALHIFEGNTVDPLGGVNPWNQNIGAALFSETKNIDGFPLSGDLSDFDVLLDDMITGSLDLGLGMNSFDIVMVLNLTGRIPGTTNSSFDFNFLNTATFGIDSDIDFDSDSGVFLTRQGNNTTVSEPAGLSLMLLGLMGGLALRRRRTI